MIKDANNVAKTNRDNLGSAWRYCKAISGRLELPVGPPRRFSDPTDEILDSDKGSDDGFGEKSATFLLDP